MPRFFKRVACRVSRVACRVSRVACRVSRVAWLGAVILAAFVGHWAATQVASKPAPPRAPSDSQQLPIEVTGADFGEVLEDSDFEWTVHLRNLGTEDIEVVRVETSCDCLQATPRAFNLRGGEVIPLRLMIDLTRKSGDQQHNGSSRKFKTSVRLSCKRQDKEFEYALHLSGRVRNVLLLSDSDTNLGEYSVLSTPLPPFRVNLKSAGPTIMAVDASIGSGSGWEVRTIHDRQVGWQIVLTPPVPMAVGTSKVPVSLTLELGDRIARHRLDFNCRIVNDIELIPTTFAFVPARIGTTVNETIRIRSVSGRSIRIDRIDAQSMNATVEPRHAGLAPEHSILVSQTITRAGKQQQSVTVRVVDQAGHPENCELTYWYYGRQ